MDRDRQACPVIGPRRKRDPSGGPAPRLVDGGRVDAGAPWSEPEDGVREVRVYGVGAERRDLLSGGLLWSAGAIITAALGGAAYVAYQSQRVFAFAHNHHDLHRAVITAALPDAGWVSMALVALVAALRGRSSARARAGVLVFFTMSLGAQVLYAPADVGGWLVAVIAPVTLAWMLESFVVEVRRWAGARRPGLDLDETPILSGVVRAAGRTVRTTGRLGLWCVRLAVDFRGTRNGLKTWVLETAPIAPGRTAPPPVRPALALLPRLYPATVTLTCRPAPATADPSSQVRPGTAAGGSPDVAAPRVSSVADAVRQLTARGITDRGDVTATVAELLGRPVPSSTIERALRRYKQEVRPVDDDRHGHGYL
jgi:hypothetical protein